MMVGNQWMESIDVIESVGSLWMFNSKIDAITCTSLRSEEWILQCELVENIMWIVKWRMSDSELVKAFKHLWTHLL